MGANRQAVESAERALALATALGDVGLELVAKNYLGYAFYALGDYRRAITVLGDIVAALEGDLMRKRFGLHGPLSVFSRTWLAMCLAEVGAFAEGVARGEQAAQIAHEADHQYSLALAHWGLGHSYFRSGELDNAIPVFERADRLCQDWRFLILHPLSASYLGAAFVLSGRLADAVPLLERAVEQAAAMGNMFSHSLEIGWLGEAYLAAGRRDDATTLAGRAMDIAVNQEERGHQAWSLRLLGEIASQGDRSEMAAAEGNYGRALALADELGMRPLVANCHLSLGKLYRRMGQGQQAQEHLTTATTMYREMDMRFWLEQAEAEMREVT
jgi:tetratricopeptide (TPR) repeat protein